MLIEKGSWRPLSFDSAAPIKLTAVEHTQQDMMRDCHFGILSGETELDITQTNRAFSSAIPLNDPLESTTMPESWVRATILVCNLVGSECAYTEFCNTHPRRHYSLSNTSSHTLD